MLMRASIDLFYAAPRATRHAQRLWFDIYGRLLIRLIRCRLMPLRFYAAERVFDAAALIRSPPPPRLRY